MLKFLSEKNVNRNSRYIPHEDGFLYRSSVISFYRWLDEVYKLTTSQYRKKYRRNFALKHTLYYWSQDISPDTFVWLVTRNEY